MQDSTSSSCIKSSSSETKKPRETIIKAKKNSWLWRDRRGPAWKQEWTERTLASMSPPPLPLVAVLLIIFVLLYVPSYLAYKNQMQETVINFKLFLLFVPVLLIFLAQFVSKFDRFMFPRTKIEYGSPNYRSWNLPWGVIALVVLLLFVGFVVSFTFAFQSDAGV
ncbi:hypothetical protein Tsubulata_010168 [Turnera subulata]|uniref:Uncharacterized protein n=1 Tax=Turnera subulata TaxID=218843 RepID=A0A9Q0G4Z1_9ROSI|nr:hypothetical protein Tsubulata_010168 [Turnera subulata]